ASLPLETCRLCQSRSHKGSGKVRRLENRSRQIHVAFEGSVMTSLPDSSQGADRTILIHIQPRSERFLQEIVDAHVHLSERRDDALIRFARMSGLRYTLAELLGTLRRYEIAHGLLLSPPLQGGDPLPNEEIIRLCKKSGEMLSPVITVEPTAKEVKAALKLAEDNRREVKAFKIRLGYVNASAESPVYDRLYDYAESEKLPVLFHTGDTAF